MIRRPPRSTLFPCTTPSRPTVLCMPTTPFPAPRRDLPLSTLDPLRDRITALCAHGGLTGLPQVSRSEEHTFELQSRQYLVCRLLLEKNKNTVQTVLPTAVIM